MDLGQRGFLSLDGLLLSGALAAVMLMPFAIETSGEVSFGRWAAERAVIAVFGAFAGLAFSASLGVLFPEDMASLPFTLLILASIYILTEALFTAH